MVRRSTTGEPRRFSDANSLSPGRLAKARSSLRAWAFRWFLISARRIWRPEAKERRWFPSSIICFIAIERDRANRAEHRRHREPHCDSCRGYAGADYGFRHRPGQHGDRCGHRAIVRQAIRSRWANRRFRRGARDSRSPSFCARHFSAASHRRPRGAKNSGASFVRKFLRSLRTCEQRDVVATATALTARPSLMRCADSCCRRGRFRELRGFRRRRKESYSHGDAGQRTVAARA